jgi:hypothetical protein
MPLSAYKIRHFLRAIQISSLVALVLLMLFAYIPIASGNDLQLLAEFSSQEWTSQRIAKDALIMAYGTQLQHVPATNELQIMLPDFEATQQAIGSSALSVDTQVLFSSTELNFTAIDTAAKAILVHPDQAADPIQLSIILNNERPYFSVDTQISAILQQKAQLRTVWLFGIEITLCALVFAGEVFRMVTMSRFVREVRKQEENQPQGGESP